MRVQYCVLVRAAALAGCHTAADATADSALLLRHLKTRSMALKSGVFGVMRALVAAAGSQGFHGEAAVPHAEAALRDEASSNAVKTEVLLFLQAALVPAAAANMAPQLGGLGSGLQAAINDKYYKVRPCALLYGQLSHAAFVRSCRAIRCPAASQDMCTRVAGQHSV